MHDIISGKRLHNRTPLERTLSKNAQYDQETLELLAATAVDNCLHYFLYMFEEYQDEIDLVFADGDKKHILAEISDGLSGELYTEDGWIEKYSEYPTSIPNMRLVTSSEIENVLALSTTKKYKYFINFVSDSEVTWGLDKNGWALATGDDGKGIFPIWHTYDYAKIAAVGDWPGYKPKEILLRDLVNELVPQFLKEGIYFGIFYAPENKGNVVSPSQLVDDIRIELDKYGEVI